MRKTQNVQDIGKLKQQKNKNACVSKMCPPQFIIKLVVFFENLIIN